MMSWEDNVYLKSGDIRQYMYKLDAKNPNDQRVKSATIVGRLEVIWKGNLGEPGRIETANLERKPTAPQEVELTLKQLMNESISLEKPFTAQCHIINRTDRFITPHLHFSKTKMSGVMCNGISGQNMGRLGPGGSTVSNIIFFPLKPGVQKITGITVIDKETDKEYTFDDVIDVFVETWIISFELPPFHSCAFTRMHVSLFQFDSCISFLFVDPTKQRINKALPDW